MPVQTHYVDRGLGAYKHAHGSLTSTDLLVTGLIQSQDVENTRKLKYLLYDFTEVSDVRIGNDVLPQLVELNRKTASNSPGLLAAIVAPNPLVFGIARNWQTFSADLGWRAQVFRERGEAIAWLLGELAREKVASEFLAAFPATKPPG